MWKTWEPSQAYDQIGKAFIDVEVIGPLEGVARVEEKHVGVGLAVAVHQRPQAGHAAVGLSLNLDGLDPVVRVVDVQKRHREILRGKQLRGGEHAPSEQTLHGCKFSVF